MTEPRLAVGIPCGDRVHTDFAMSLTLMASVMKYKWGLLPVKGSVIAMNRNGIVQGAIKAEASHLLMIDTDLAFPPDMANRMMDIALERNLDVLGGAYRARLYPHRSLVKTINGKTVTEEIPEVERIPGGLMLINMRVFKDLDQPYFRHPILEDVDDDLHRIGGEDYDFCDRVRTLGFKVHLDVALTLVAKHITDMGIVYDGAHADSFRYVCDSARGADGPIAQAAE